MITNRQYEMEQFLEKVVKIFDAQMMAMDHNGCKKLSNEDALKRYETIAKDIKIFLMGEKLSNHRNFFKILCERSCWCWDLEIELLKLEEERRS